MVVGWILVNGHRDSGFYILLSAFGLRKISLIGTCNNGCRGGRANKRSSSGAIGRIEDPNMRTATYFFGGRGVSTCLVRIKRGEEVRTVLASLRNVCSRCCLTAETIQGSV